MNDQKVSVTIQEPDTPILSKNAQKRLLKQAKYIENKDVIRKVRKDARLRRQTAKRLNPDTSTPKKPKRIPHKDQTPIDINIVIDCDYNDLMSEKSLASQLKWAYSAMHTQSPPRFAWTSFHGALLDATFTLFPEYAGWPMQISTHHYTSFHENANVTYLTADSPHELADLELGHAYIVGGIVDHNQYPRLCLDRAVKAGIKTARLPIDAYIKMKSRKILTVNNIVEILVKFAECRDWKEAFLGCIPTRKVVKEVGIEEEAEEDERLEAEVDSETCNELVL